MKIKSLFIILLAVGVSASLYFSKDTKVLAEYSQRTTQEPLMSPEGRQAIYQALKGNIQTGKIEAQDYIDMKKSVAKHKSLSNKSIDYTWTELGPDNLGGRTRAILPVGENVVFAGSVAGGLWKSVNAGNTWNKVDADIRIVGSIGQAANGDIYVGTGSSFEGNPSGNGGSEFVGEGMFFSDDGGDTFTLVPETEPNFMSPGDGWAYINAMSADAAHPNRIWFAAEEGVGYVEDGNEPVIVTNGIGAGLEGQDIEVSPDGSTIIVSLEFGRIRLSTDGGQTFIAPSDETDLPNTGKSRARVAISPSNPDYLYVAYASNGGSFGGLWQSTDNGTTWVELMPGGVEYLNIAGTQAYYDLALAVDPTDPEKVFLGGLTMWKAGSQIFEEQITTYFGFGSNHVHPDIHEIVFAENNRMYIGCDGGVYGSEDVGQTFFSLNSGYNTQTFYNMSQSSGISGVIGGAQDNGSIYISGEDGSLSGFDVSTGDGFGCEISLVTEGLGLGFVTTQNGNLRRANVDGNNQPSSFYDSNIINQTNLSGPEMEAGPFMTDIALFEDTEDEDSQHTIEIVNPYLYDLFDADLTDDEPVLFQVQTNNKNIDFEYTLLDTLRYWAELERPAITTLAPLTQDPTYWWLNPQPLAFIDTITVVEVTGFEVDTVFGYLDPILYCDTTCINDTIFFQDTIIQNVIDTCFINCITIGFDSIMVPDTTFFYDQNTHFEYNYAADVLTDVREHKLINDPYTSLFAIGFTGGDGIWITREALNFNVSPSWMRVVDSAPSSGTNCLTFSHDGDRMYYSGWGEQTVREVANLDQMYTPGTNGYTGGDVDNLEYRNIRSGAGGQITGIAEDYFDPNHMVISVGGYGTAGGGKVQETWNALDDTPTWQNIWFSNSNPDGLHKMPCYDLIIDRLDPSGATIVVGTEFGIFATEDGGDNWAMEVNTPASDMTTGIDRTPVFELRQQVVLNKRWWNPENTGIIYAATHGRGMFRTGVTHPEVSVSEIENSTNVLNDLEIYPNPTSSATTISFELNTLQDVVIQIYSIQGELVKSIQRDNLSSGKQTIQLNVEDLTQGNYILRLDAGNSSKVGKFMIIK